jgi:hypothetical protein
MPRAWLIAFTLTAFDAAHADSALPVDCPPDQIRYSLLARDLPSAQRLDAQGWRASRLSADQAAALGLWGEAEESMAQHLARRGMPRPWLLTRCWNPPLNRSIAAYVEEMQRLKSMASEASALVAGDGESGQWWPLAEFLSRMFEGQTDRTGNAQVSEANPPTWNSLAYGFDEDGPLGLRTKGMRKVGLPDLSLGPAMPGYSFYAWMEILANMALAGRLPLEPDRDFTVSLDDPAVSANLRKRRPAADQLRLRWRAVPQASKPMLRLELVEPSGLSPFEQQVLMSSALWDSRFAKLGAPRARALDLAVARSKARLADLLGRLPELQRQGGRLWVMSRIDLAADNLASAHWEPEYNMWEEVLGKDGHGQLLVRRWPIDPQQGGQRPRVGSVFAVGKLRLTIEDGSLSVDMADDWLLQDAKGRFSAGEPMALLTTWGLEKAAAGPTSASR